MLPWRNSWFQIAFFAWLVSGALLIVDYAPKIPASSAWMQAFQRAPRQPAEAPAKPFLPTEQQSPARTPAPARPAPMTPPGEPPTKSQPASKSEPSTKDEAVSKGTKGLKLFKTKNYKAALPLLTAACDAGDAHGCSYEGRVYGGLGVPTDKAKMDSLFKKGCDGGDPEGCEFLGWSLSSDDRKTAFSLFMKSCDGGGSKWLQWWRDYRFICILLADGRQVCATKHAQRHLNGLGVHQESVCYRRVWLLHGRWRFVSRQHRNLATVWGPSLPGSCDGDRILPKSVCRNHSKWRR